MIVKTITKEQLERRLRADPNLQVVNVLEPQYHYLGSIRGSKLIPLSTLSNNLPQLDKNRDVILYSASYECNASHQAALKLTLRGYKVQVYEGGIQEWKKAGLPTEKSLRAA